MQDQSQKVLTETLKAKVPDQLRGLFCEPPFLEGEDLNLYWGLLAAVIDERQPQTASDWIAVSDLVTKLLEEHILRRASNALIRGGMLESLGKSFAEEEEPDKVQGLILLAESELLWKRRAAAAKRWVKDYTNEIPKDRKPIGSLLAQFGMTEPELYARAFKQNGEALQMFERMIAARERGRRKLRQEDERRRRRQVLSKTEKDREGVAARRNDQ